MATGPPTTQPGVPWTKLAVLALLLVGIGVGIAYRDHLSLEALAARESQLKAFEQEHPLAVYGAAFAVYVAVTGLSLPGAAVLTLVVGWFFGLIRGTILVSFASTAGATIAFLLSRFLFRDAIQSRFGDRLRWFNEQLDHDGPFFLFTLRLVPLVPFFVINAVMGLTRIKTSTFWWVSQLGMLAGTIVYVYAGSAVPDLTTLAEEGVGAVFTPGFLIKISIAFALLGFFPLVARKAIAYFKPTAPAVIEEATAKTITRSETQSLGHASHPPSTTRTNLMTTAADKPIELLPYDEHNQRLEASVRPPDWTNPTPDGPYHLVVIGAGTAGLVTAAVAAGLGARVALVERNLMGGDCLNVGCVPSKGVISAARVASTVKHASEFGVYVDGGYRVDFAEAMQRMRRLRANISPADSAERFSKEKGIDVYLGQARFTSSDTVEVGGASLKFKKAVIATGARAAAPPIAGLDTVEYLTNESVFSLTELPASLGVIGAGPIGCELAQAFARFGSEVHLVNSSPSVLPREDEDAARIVQAAMERDGVRIYGHGRSVRLSPEESQIQMLANVGGGFDIAVDKLLIAVGRTPNVDGLGLEAVGVEYDKREGLKVNDYFQTTNPRIYAAGDICSPYKFTHAADFMARAVVRNALFTPLGFGKVKASSLVIPWATYTSPELAHVGLTEKQAKEQGVAIDTFRQDLEHVDRAILDGATEGFVKIHVAKGTDKILGATIVAENAGDLIGSLSIAMTHGVGLSKIASSIHPYPTQAEAIRKVGDLYSRTKLTPFAARFLKAMLKLST